MITVEYYGVLKGIVGARSETFGVRSTVAELLADVALRHPDIAGALPGTAVARDEELVPRSAELRDGVTVALLPPVSGG